MLKILTRRSSLAAIAATAMLALTPAANALTFTDVITFGDSLSDTGNISATTGFPLPPYAPGRFTSNFTDGTPGLVWLDYVAAGLGGNSDPSLLGGSNYAWGGARIGPDIALFPPTLYGQVDFYLGDTGGVADQNALYVVFGGGNDVRDNAVATTATDIGAIITELYDAGARHFLVPNLPDIGLTPESLADAAPGGDGATISAASQTHNENLRLELKLLEETLGIDIIEFNLSAIFSSILAEPSSYGFSNVTEACFTGGLDGSGGTLCSDPDSYLFFDGIHPTAAAHQLFGNLALKEVLDAKVIPVPAALPLLLSALGILGLARRRAA